MFAIILLTVSMIVGCKVGSDTSNPVATINPGIPGQGGASSTAFISVWNTQATVASSSANNEIKLPLISSGTYNFQINWGDGKIDTITTYNQAEVTHKYDTPGTYTIAINKEITG
jgi:hypothetical protein